MFLRLCRVGALWCVFVRHPTLLRVRINNNNNHNHKTNNKQNQKVLTAAHCVFSRTANAWMANWQISPARYRSGGGVDTKPYGTTGWSHVTTYRGWTRASNSNPWPYDIAVIKTADAALGARTGWQGLAWSSTPFAGTIYTAGYPGAFFLFFLLLCFSCASTQSGVAVLWCRRAGRCCR